MTPELWERLKPLFYAAIQQPPEHREQFITEACGSDSELRQELTALINASDENTASGNSPLMALETWLTGMRQPFRVGEVVLGRFKIVRHLGSGGMGDVYEALDFEMGRVALKVIRSDIADSPAALLRFKKEVQLARKVGDPHVCRVHELFVLPGAQASSQSLFLTMEFLEGITLRDKIRESGPQPWLEAQAIGIDICAGLQAIHRSGIIHRDLKSRNVMIASRNGTACAVLMDFGLAHELTTPTSETSIGLTRPGALAGTPAYMAPEQFEGAELTPATDIYALGIILYEMLTGQHPFAASTTVGAAVLRGRRPQRASSIQQGVPRYFDEVISKCLEYEPGLRYQSAAEVAEVLRTHPLSARGLIGRQREMLQKRGTFAVLSAAILAIVIAGGLWLRFHRYQRPSSEVQHWYDVGTAALREGTYVKATRALQVAVDHDPKFALGHARLAEAWSELDFAGRAQEEMLLASTPELEQNLPDLDQMYIEAVRSTLTHDFATAEKQYELILSALPKREKASGYVDLGLAKEKARNTSEALKDYEAATKLDKDNPAAFMRLGTLRNHLQDAAGGEAAFEQAEKIYQETSNSEGLAEIAYQRGYAATVRGDAAQARTYLQASLDLARQISSVQLEIRALAQMSSVEYSHGNTSQAVEDANQAIQLARENDLEYWSGDGLMRLGNAYLSSRELEKAEPPLEEALHIAEQGEQPRLEANARISLASARSMQRKWDESVELAQPALSYYKSVGMVDQATRAAILIVRAQRNKQDLTAALSSAGELLDISAKSNNPSLIEMSEEEMGDILGSLERYPDALSHFDQALRIAQSIHANESYQALHCADVLWHLGRFAEAQNMIVTAQRGNEKNPGITSDAKLVSAEILLSRGKVTQVIAVVNLALTQRPSTITPDDMPEFRLLRARAELGLGQTRKASDDLSRLADWSKQDGNEDEANVIKLAQAEIDRKIGSPELAKPLADLAHEYFSGSGKKSSEWLSLLELARVYRSMGAIQQSKASAQQALAIWTDLEHTWPPNDYESYSARPDNKAARSELVSYERY